MMTDVLCTFNSTTSPHSLNLKSILMNSIYAAVRHEYVPSAELHRGGPDESYGDRKKVSGEAVSVGGEKTITGNRGDPGSTKLPSAWSRFFFYSSIRLVA